MELAQTKIYTEEDYYNLPETVRAELINGQFYYMAAPSRIHQKILSALHILIGNYIRERAGSCEIYPAPFAVKLFHDKETIVEPDISVICDPKKLTESGCSGAPDWVIEIVSPGTSSHDYVRKLNLYANAGVREYWIVNPKNKTVFVYFFEQNAFDVRSYTFQDKIQVNIYPDLSIDFVELSF